jgi:hypothetical protein
MSALFLSGEISPAKLKKFLSPEIRLTNNKMFLSENSSGVYPVKSQNEPDAEIIFPPLSVRNMPSP